MIALKEANGASHFCLTSCAFPSLLLLILLLLLLPTLASLRPSMFAFLLSAPSLALFAWPPSLTPCVRRALSCCCLRLSNASLAAMERERVHTCASVCVCVCVLMQAPLGLEGMLQQIHMPTLMLFPAEGLVVCASSLPFLSSSSSSSSSGILTLSLSPLPFHAPSLPSPCSPVDAAAPAASQSVSQSVDSSEAANTENDDPKAHTVTRERCTA